MYRPEAFRLDDPAVLLEHASKHPFATVVTVGEGGLEVSHLPLLVDEGRRVLLGHLARHNPQRAHLAAGAEVLAIFHGPHGYVSPSAYEVQPSVPTWNYAVVHARGRPRLVDELALRAMLDAMVARFDSSDWRVSTDEGFLRGRLDAIVGFEIAITHLEGKWKLSQNRTPSEQNRVATWLESRDDSSRELAALMRSRR